MLLSDLKQELLDNKLRPVYVFTGDELALQDVYINKIKELSGLDLIRVEYLRDIYVKLKAKTLIKSKPFLYVIRNDEIYFKSDSSWDKVINETSLKGNIVILLYSNVETSSGFFKKHESIATEFNFLGVSPLKNRLEATTGLRPQYCEDIVKMCGNNYGRIKNELFKLQTLAKVENCSLEVAYLEAKKNNMIHEDVGDIIFDFTNAVVERNILKSYELLKKIKTTDEGALKLVTVLYNSFRNALIVQSTAPKDRTEEILGLTKAQIYVTSQRIDRYNLFELVNIIKTLRFLEKGIKTGEVEPIIAVDYFLQTCF